MPETRQSMSFLRPLVYALAAFNYRGWRYIFFGTISAWKKNMKVIKVRVVGLIDNFLEHVCMCMFFWILNFSWEKLWFGWFTRRLGKIIVNNFWFMYKWVKQCPCKSIHSLGVSLSHPASGKYIKVSRGSLLKYSTVCGTGLHTTHTLFMQHPERSEDHSFQKSKCLEKPGMKNRSTFATKNATCNNSTKFSFSSCSFPTLLF